STGHAALAPARAPQPVERSSGLPGWVWGLGIAVIAALLWRMFIARRQAAALTPGSAGTSYGAASPGSGPGYGPMGGPPSAGSGMLGTGVAAAGGFAAGM